MNVVWKDKFKASLSSHQCFSFNLVVTRTAVSLCFDFLTNFLKICEDLSKKVREWFINETEHIIPDYCSMHILCTIRINVPGSCSAGMYPILQLWHLNKHRGVSVSNFTDTFPVEFAVWGEIRETENISNGPLSCLTDDGQNKQNVWGGSQKKWGGWTRISPSRTNMQRPG